MQSPFAIFRKNQKTLMVVMTGVAMFAFVFLDAFTKMDTSNSMSILIILGMLFGATVFWFFSQSNSGFNYEIIVAGGLIGGALGYVYYQYTLPPPAVHTSVANISTRELQQMVIRLQTANQFVNSIFYATNDANNPFSQPPLFRYGEATPQEDAVLSYLLQQEAKEIGIAISDETVTAEINRISNDKLTEEKFREIRRQVGVGETELYDILREQIAARTVISISVPRSIHTPDEYWEMYKKLNVTQSLDVAAIPVAEFTGLVPEPKDSELTDFFARHKDQFPQADGTPGFRQPRKMKIAYLEYKYEDAVKEVPPLTDAEVKAKHKELYGEPPETKSAPDMKVPDQGSPVKAPKPEVEESKPLEPELTPEKQPPPPKIKPETKPETSPEKQDDKKPDAEKKTSDNKQNKPTANFSVEETPDQDSTTKPVTKPEEQSDLPVIAPKPESEAEFDPATSLYRPLDDDLRKEIAGMLLREKAIEILRRKVQAAADMMDDLVIQFYSDTRNEADSKPGADQFTKTLKAYGRKEGWFYEETPFLSYEELSTKEDYPLSEAVQFQEPAAPQAPSRSVAETLFSQSPDQNFKAEIARDVLTDNGFAYWKIAEQESHVPNLDEPGVREQVLKAWKEDQARPLAEKRAQALVEVIKKSKAESMTEAVTDQTINGTEDSIPVIVVPTEQFSWLEQPLPDPNNPFSPRIPRLSSISSVEQPGHQFMETVFDVLQPGEVGVAPNADRSMYYVVQVKERIPANPVEDDEFKKKMLKTNMFAAAQFRHLFGTPYDHLSQAQQGALSREWFDRLEKKYDLRLNLATR